MVMGSHDVIIDISISHDEYLLWYQGTVKNVYTHCIDGRSVRFPAKILQPFVTHNGVRGRFMISFDEHKKFKGITRLT